MNLSINPVFQEAVQNFVWPEQTEDSKPTSISALDLQTLVTEVSKNIISASDVRNKLNQMNKNVSLVQTCYLSVQDQDGKKYGNTTVAKITNASLEEKKILNHTFRELSKDFVQLPEGDLKAITLLLGIHRVHDLASSVIIALPPEKTSVIDDIENSLKTLKAIRSQYVATSQVQSVATKYYLETIDSKIVEMTKQLEELKKQKTSEKVA